MRVNCGSVVVRFVPLLGAETRAREWRRTGGESPFFSHASPGRPWRALATSKTHTNHSQVTLRSCLLREMRVFRSFKNTFSGIELPAVSLLVRAAWPTAAAWAAVCGFYYFL